MIGEALGVSQLDTLLDHLGGHSHPVCHMIREVEVRGLMREGRKAATNKHCLEDCGHKADLEVVPGQT